MDLIFTEEEKDLFRKLQNVKSSLVSRSLNSGSIEKLFIKYIILNRFASLNLEPSLGQFDAFADEIESYLDKSIEIFASFLKESKITE